ncbi:MAG: tetratricopeptide repeat protein [Xanthobacteraceae bacterium]|nr:tetratricopeptide repeat protein [Xanthobacteraceae bacterium]
MNVIAALTRILAGLILIAFSASSFAFAQSVAEKDKAVCHRDYEKIEEQDVRIAACDRLIQTTKRGPALADHHQQKAHALYRKNDFDGAVRNYEIVIEIDPKNAYSHDALGDALLAKGDTARALSSYNNAIKTDPEIAVPYVSRGQLQEKLGDIAAAKESYKLALTKPAKDEVDQWAHDVAKERLTALEKS